MFHQKYQSFLYDVKQIWNYQYGWMYTITSFITDQPLNSLLEGIINENPMQAQSLQSAHCRLFKFFLKSYSTCGLYSCFFGHTELKILLDWGGGGISFSHTVMAHMCLKGSIKLVSNFVRSNDLFLNLRVSGPTSTNVEILTLWQWYWHLTPGCQLYTGNLNLRP